MASLYYYLFYFLQNSLNPRKFDFFKSFEKIMYSNMLNKNQNHFS